jgi:hypothetical protein
VIPVRAATGVTTLGPLDAFAFGFAVWLVLEHRAVLPLLLRTPAVVPLAAFAAVASVGVWTAGDPATTVKEASKLFEAAALYFGFAYLFWREGAAGAVPRAYRAWLATMCVVVLVAAVWQYQFVRSVADPFSDPEVTQRYFRFGWGTYAASNYLAGMLLLFVPAVACRLSMARRRRAATAALLALLGGALVATVSRGALLALLVVLAGQRSSQCAAAWGGSDSCSAWPAQRVAGIAASPVAFRVFELAGTTLDALSNNPARPVARGGRGTSATPPARHRPGRARTGVDRRRAHVRPQRRPADRGRDGGWPGPLRTSCSLPRSCGPVWSRCTRSDTPAPLGCTSG